MKTLMTTDGSLEATTALRTASRLLRKSRNDVHVLCVAPELALPHGKAVKRSAMRLRTEYEKRIGRETEAILERAGALLGEEGIDAKAISESGSPSEVIVRLAAEYDLTVVGASGRYDSPNLGLGPVASRIVEHAESSVLVARRLAGEGNLRVLIGVDGSAASRRALRAVAAYLDMDEAEITLLHVKETPWIHLGLEPEWFDSPEELSDRSSAEVRFEENFQRQVEDLLEEAQAQLEQYNYSVMTMVEEGNPATEIVGEAERGDYDLIVLGSTGLRDVKHSVLGSVSAKVAWQAPCSVAVIK